jgi:hypothetical protein
MDRAYLRRGLAVSLLALCAVAAFVIFPFYSSALNIRTYKDTITDSRPEAYANHTLDFIIDTAVAPSGYLEFSFPNDFEIITSSLFGERNVELAVNGIVRDASSTPSATVDEIAITHGAGGIVRYTLNPTTGIGAGSHLVFKIGNHTLNASYASVSYSTTTGTTTTYRDTPPVKNSPSIGTHKVGLSVGGASADTYAEFSIAVVQAVGTGNVNTREFVPPVRFNGNPLGEVGGTTFNVELSLETDELSVCKYSTATGTPYTSMNRQFGVTGQLVHSQLVAVATGTVNTYFVRCIDDEGNFNTDDYIITFISLPPPVGNPSGGGGNDGNGGGTGTGGGTGSGGSGSSGSGSSGGGGSSAGNGGGGGGSGGSSGGGSSAGGGGGFESTDGPYQSGDAEVTIEGYAFPGSTVTALVDGKLGATTRASNDGSYSVTIKEIARGAYTFGVYAVGSDGIKSSTFSTSFTVTGGRASNLSNINVMPSVSVSPNPVTPPQAFTVSGRSIPNANITIETQTEKGSGAKKTYTSTSNASGVWTLSVDSAGFTNGTYKIRAKSEQTTGLLLKTNFSGYSFYGVGQSANVPLSADLNRDGKINLTDFSILLFWWGSDGGDSNPPADINKDGKVNLTDFSILLFNWTG